MSKRLPLYLACVLLVLGWRFLKREPPRPPRFEHDFPGHLFVPRSFDAQKPAPLLLALHGYGSVGDFHLGSADLRILGEGMGAVVLAPDGTRDGRSQQFWNATDSCCDFQKTGVDDVAYLARLIDATRTRYNIDPRKIYVIGQSNGGFMAHRFACDRPDLVSAVVSIAGAAWLDPARCTPKIPVPILQIHGDADHLVHYDGAEGTNSLLTVQFPGARETIERWMTNDGCTGPLEDVPGALDLDATQPGAESHVQRANGCPAGIDVELWTMHGVGHVPVLGGAFLDAVQTWLTAHARPEASAVTR